MHKFELPPVLAPAVARELKAQAARNEQTVDEAARRAVEGGK